MIAKIFIYILLVVVLTDFYLYRRYLRHACKARAWKLMALGLPSFFFCAFTVKMAILPNFMPDDHSILYLYLFILGVFIMPKTWFVFCLWVGTMLQKRFRLQRNWGIGVGVLGTLSIIFLILYGGFVGFRQLEVIHLHLYSKDIPPAFEGYRMVHISDLHMGTYQGCRMPLLQEIVDSIKAQQADVILFTGDLQNVQPSEVSSLQSVLQQIRARDGVFSVFGNHDYSLYIKADPVVMAANERALMECQQRMGWQLLMNEHRIIRRGADSIVIAGTENDGKKPFPSRADLGKALKGVGENAYVVLLQHDPSSWQRRILPHSHVQLTLSGHTHGGQINIGGLRPTLLSYPQDGGLYEEQGRKLYVTKGLGGTIPLRFGVPKEIVVFTLHHSK